MKKILFIFSFFFLGVFGTYAQTTQSAPQLTLKQSLNKYDIKSLQVYDLMPPNLQKLQQEDATRDRDGYFYRIGVTTTVNYLLSNSGSWNVRSNGDRVWQLRIKSKGAEALTVFFDHFKLYGKSKIQVFNIQGEPLTTAMTADDNQETGVQNFALVPSDEIILRLTEPQGVTPSEISIYEIGYAYRGVHQFLAKNYGDAQSCQNDINSSTGNAWQTQKKGVARILLKDGNSQGWCTGSLVNNTAQNCKPYFLTAQHCGVNSSTQDFNQWRFYFNFEKPTYSSDNLNNMNDPNNILGCVYKCSSKDVIGESTIKGSDYQLVQLGSANNETTIINKLKNTIGAYWNGWDASGTASSGGVGIHHPSGDVKKISVYTATTQSVGYNGNGLQSHWRVTWSSGVTEGGSSGSPLFNGDKRIIGTLSGGLSFCTDQNQPDSYGKMYYHWDKNTYSSSHVDLKVFLDPNNTGNKILDGSSDPCTVVNAPPVANFNVSQTTIPVNTTLTFNNTSTNNPTSSTWTITPATGWSYAGGTNGSSTNPQVKFTTVGTYSVKLTVSNSYGSDTKTQNSYITVTQSAGPCAALSEGCDEYIARVLLNTIDNSSSCDKYKSYTTPTTTLTAGQTYDIAVQSGIIGQGAGYFYSGDIVAAWIDYNGDGQFTANERVYYEALSASSTLMKTVTIPSNITAGTTTFRVRIGYQSVDPCGTSDDGEVEDYKITLASGGGSNPNPTTPCTATSSECDEYISNVLLKNASAELINKTSGCDNYSNYTTPSPTLILGTNYSLKVGTNIVGEVELFYTNDIISAWIDYNNDGQFSANERIYNVQVSSNTTTQDLTQTFTIPASASTGTKTMRVRINYQTNDPCGSSQYGEVEDYKVILANGDNTNDIVNLSEVQDLSIYPNPTSQFVNFYTSSTDENNSFQIQVIDLAGKIVMNTETSHLNQYQMNVEKLEIGMYQIVVKQGDKISKRKFVKE